jgi:hypothetical protein
MAEKYKIYENSNLKNIIKLSGLKQKWIAGKLDIDETLFAHQIAGRRSIPHDQLKGMSKILKCRMSDLGFRR